MRRIIANSHRPPRHDSARPLCHTPRGVMWLSRSEDNLADEVESGGVAVPVVPAARPCRVWSSHAVITSRRRRRLTAVVGVGVHAVLVSVPVVRLAGPPSRVPAVRAHLAPRPHPRPATLRRHVVSTCPDVPAAPACCTPTPCAVRRRYQQTIYDARYEIGYSLCADT